MMWDDDEQPEYLGLVMVVGFPILAFALVIAKELWWRVA
jgi:hypothetical protein